MSEIKTKSDEMKSNQVKSNGVKPVESDLSQIETNSSVDFPIDFVFRAFLSQHTDGGELVKAAMKDDGKVLRVETRKVKAIE